MLIQEILVSGGRQKTPGLVKRLNRLGTFVGIASADPYSISASHLIKLNIKCLHICLLERPHRLFVASVLRSITTTLSLPYTLSSTTASPPQSTQPHLIERRLRHASPAGTFQSSSSTIITRTHACVTKQESRYLARQTTLNHPGTTVSTAVSISAIFQRYGTGFPSLWF